MSPRMVRVQQVVVLRHHRHTKREVHCSGDSTFGGRQRTQGSSAMGYPEGTRPNRVHRLCRASIPSSMRAQQCDLQSPMHPSFRYTRCLCTSAHRCRRTHIASLLDGAYPRLSMDEIPHPCIPRQGYTNPSNWCWQPDTRFCPGRSLHSRRY